MSYKLPHASLHASTGVDPIAPFDILADQWATDRATASDCFTIPHAMANSTSSLTAGNVHGGLARSRAGGTYTQVRYVLSSTLSGVTDLRVGVADTTGAQLQQTANLTSNAAAAAYTVALAASVTIAKGGYVFLCIGALGGVCPTRSFSVGTAAAAGIVLANGFTIGRGGSGWAGGAFPSLSSTAFSAIIPYLELLP